MNKTVGCVIHRTNVMQGCVTCWVAVISGETENAPKTEPVLVG